MRDKTRHSLLDFYFSQSRKAPNKNPFFRLSGRLKDHVLEKIITSGKKNPTIEYVEYALPNKF